MVFLKGYQWPFDWRKVRGGSSIVDILVYIETVLKGRRVFLDFRGNPEGFAFDDLSDEARTYLTRSEALLPTPIARLEKMNPGAIALYRDHGIDIATEPLEIAVCAQHNNGGLAANLWWESLNVKHLFPLGEVNGSHGIYRPGGSALNSGQVAGFPRRRVHRPSVCGRGRWMRTSCARRRPPASRTLGLDSGVGDQPRQAVAAGASRVPSADVARGGAHPFVSRRCAKPCPEAWAQWARVDVAGDPADLGESLRNRQLCFAHAVYLEALAFALESGTGSRGSSITLDPDGVQVHDKLGDAWRIVPEDEAFRDKVLETVATPDGEVRSAWVPRRPLPHPDSWFETAWARYREGAIYDNGGTTY